jgi:hypothetical protein
MNMTQKIAVAVIHGIGKQKPDFADQIIRDLTARCRADCGDDVVICPVYWASVLDQLEDVLWNRIEANNRIRYKSGRRFLIDFLADAFAYQIAPKDRAAYDAIHAVFAATLKQLAQDAGETAPLCVIAHSLGTVIASNFIYDLQTEPRRRIIADSVRAMMDTPLERGETLTSLYTMGSPIALWSLRYTAFGKPVRVPDRRLKQHHPRLRGEWINFYDADDLIGFPLKTLNKAYGKVVCEDREVNVGSLLTSWNPLSHFGYWADRDVLDPIASGITAIWKAVNLPAV